MNEVTRSNKLLTPLLLTTLMSCGQSLASDLQIDPLSDAQVFFCDASLGASYQLNIVTTEQGSLEAIVFHNTAKTGAELASNMTLSLDQEVRLSWSPAVTGFSFSGQGFELVGLANAAVLHDGAQAVVCHLQARETRTSVATPALANSLGGRLRSGPGLDFITRTVLPAKTPVTLLENTELSLDGYDWFRVETQAGLTGYQWGGVICSIEGVLTGLLRQCP